MLHSKREGLLCSYSYSPSVILVYDSLSETDNGIWSNNLCTSVHVCLIYLQISHFTPKLLPMLLIFTIGVLPMPSKIVDIILLDLPFLKVKINSIEALSFMFRYELLRALLKLTFVKIFDFIIRQLPFLVFMRRIRNFTS